MNGLRCGLYIIYTFYSFFSEGPVKRCRHEYSFREYTSGIFMSPQFPEKYGNELKCVYFFRADDRGRIKITFDLFKLEGPNSDKGQVLSYSLHNNNENIYFYCIITSQNSFFSGLFFLNFPRSSVFLLLYVLIELSSNRWSSS